MNTDIMTTKETAAYLRIHVKTLEAKRANGTGPAWIRSGRKVFYRLAAIDSWLAANTHEVAA